MKRIFSLFILFLSLTAAAQIDSTTPPFKKFPTLPPLQVLLGDSITKYTKDDLPKKKQTLIVLFNPDCEHCQHEAENFVKAKDDLKKTQIVMISTAPLYRIKGFAETYGLDKMPNVVMAKDPHYFLIPFYDVRNFPFMALYDKKGNLLQTVEGSVKVEKLLQIFEGK